MQEWMAALKSVEIGKREIRLVVRPVVTVVVVRLVVAVVVVGLVVAEVVGLGRLPVADSSSGVGLSQ
jgi:hypothetical protein